MSLEEWDLRECSTGGGAVIKGSKKASRGAKRRRISWQVEPGGGWRSDGGLGEKFLVFHFQTRNLFSITWELGSGWACLDRSLADLVNERRRLEWKWKFCHFWLVLLFLGFCLSAWYGLMPKVLANKCIKYIEASESSKDQLESIYYLKSLV